MKAYTLRVEDDILSTLKEIGIKENRSVKDIILEAIEQCVSRRASKSQSLKEKTRLEWAARLAQRVPLEDIVRSIREDRGR